MENIKEAFINIKQDINSLKEDISFLKYELEETNNKLKEVCEIMVNLYEKTNNTLISDRQTDRQIRQKILLFRHITLILSP